MAHEFTLKEQDVARRVDTQQRCMSTTRSFTQFTVKTAEIPISDTGFVSTVVISVISLVILLFVLARRQDAWWRFYARLAK